MIEANQLCGRIFSCSYKLALSSRSTDTNLLLQFEEGVESTPPAMLKMNSNHLFRLILQQGCHVWTHLVVH